MLAITEDAAAAIESIVSSSGLPAGAGLRITQELNVEAEGKARTDLRLSLVESAEAGDQVLEGTQIFLEPEASTSKPNRSRRLARSVQRMALARQSAAPTSKVSDGPATERTSPTSTTAFSWCFRREFSRGFLGGSRRM